MCPMPAALPHGELREVLPDVFFVTGTVEMRTPIAIRFSRNMTIFREEGRLVLVNSVRLDEAGLAKLDALGKVTDVIRLAGFHGMDDPFYKDRYGATVSAVRGQRYTSGLDPNAAKTYFTPDVELSADSKLPLRGARLHLFDSTPPEALLVLERQGGIVVSGDALQNWDQPDEFFSTIGKVMMRVMGFIKACNVGPAWLKQAKPAPERLRGVLELPFENVLPAHGRPVLGGAREKFRPAIERAAAR
ncbi:MAG: hypothetical protein U0271_24110 [Polyangiaceae bacterium]